MCDIKFCEKDDLINSILGKLKEELKGNQIFLSEADLQFSFAKKLYEINEDDENYKGKISNIILEYPIKTIDLYSQTDKESTKEIKNALRNKQFCKFENYNYKECEYYKNSECTCNKIESKYENSRESIDLFFIYDDTYYFIEFKYKLDELKDCCRYGEDVLCGNFNLKKQSADDYGRYSVYEDIERMENIKLYAKEKGKNCKSFVIFITNHANYWSENKETGRLACNMPLKDEKNPIYTKKGVLVYDNGKTKRRSLHIKNSYKLNWIDFKTLGDDKGSNKDKKTFRCLVIDLNE